MAGASRPFALLPAFRSMPRQRIVSLHACSNDRHETRVPRTQLSLLQIDGHSAKLPPCHSYPSFTAHCLALPSCSRVVRMSGTTPTRMMRRARGSLLGLQNRPKHLDPVQAYSEDEATFLYQIYEPPLQYHYLKRPYALEPAAAETMPRVRLIDAAGNPLAADAPRSSSPTRSRDHDQARTQVSAASRIRNG